MNTTKKLGYMALGAGILALGIAIGQWTIPDIEAQNNGVFDKIVCRELEVVNQDGNKAISLSASINKDLMNMRQNVIHIYDGKGEKKAVSIGWHDERPRAESSVIVRQETGAYAVKLAATGAFDGNTWHGITIYDRSMIHAIIAAAIGNDDENGRGIGVYDKSGFLPMWTTPHWNIEKINPPNWDALKR